MDTENNTKDKFIVQTIKDKLSNSIKPSIEESERFILFLNGRFNLNLPDNLIINIQETTETTKGFYMPKEHLKHYSNTIQELNYICLSSLHLKNTPYETICHELAHFINDSEGHKAKNNYHTKEFKKVAEMLLLKVSKGKHGFNHTEETEEFKKMVAEEFKPSQDAFHIFQNSYKGKKEKSRNLLFKCGCGCKIRTARNEEKPLKAICSYCNTEFIEVKKEGDEEQ